MSCGTTCPASCHGRERENVRIVHRNHNHSAFNGYHRTWSEYTGVVCINCGRSWRTKAAWLWRTPMLKKGELRDWPDLEACV